MSPVKVMVVDDNVEILDLFKNLLEDLNYKVLLAQDGTDALQLLRLEKPDIIFLDIKMPGFDGIETLKRVREYDNGKCAKVVMITGYGDLDSARQAMRLGAHEYLTKPIDLNMIKSICREVVHEMVVVDA